MFRYQQRRELGKKFEKIPWPETLLCDNEGPATDMSIALRRGDIIISTHRAADTACFDLDLIRISFDVEFDVAKHKQGHRHHQSVARRFLLRKIVRQRSISGLCQF